MRFLKSILPNLTIVLAISLVVLLYLDNRNPMMGFLYGKPFIILGTTFALCSICVSIMYYVSQRKEHNPKTKASDKVENSPRSDE